MPDGTTRKGDMRAHQFWTQLACAGIITVHTAAAFAQTRAPEIPLVRGLTFVLAVHAPTPALPNSSIAQGDYEMVVTIDSVDAGGIALSTRIDAVDERGRPLHLNIQRRIDSSDLANARLQILGFHTNDPAAIPGATALGPSLAIMRDLRTTGRALYSVQNFRHLSTSSGALVRAGSSPVPFSVLLNGARVDLPAVRVTGQLKYGQNVRPWEEYLLDHPQHPITLRFANGAVNAGIPFTPETTREVVRIDFPVGNDRQMEEALRTRCRVEVPGIYFDFNLATLNPQSNRALTGIADLLTRNADWRIRIEGHTDNVGTDAYNQDLSMRRAATVRAALVSDFSIASDRLTSQGFGEARPVETNDTIAGRARNRRVELVRTCQ
jgi:outer membrane protein OmpA-like peptidoglycan-associated protein